MAHRKDDDQLDQDIELMTNWRDIRNEFIAAKAVQDRDPVRYKKAKKKMSEFRTHWREFRECFAPEVETEEGDAVAEPRTIKTKSEVKK